MTYQAKKNKIASVNMPSSPDTIVRDLSSSMKKLQTPSPEMRNVLINSRLLSERVLGLPPISSAVFMFAFLGSAYEALREDGALSQEGVRKSLWATDLSKAFIQSLRQNVFINLKDGPGMADLATEAAEKIAQYLSHTTDPHVSTIKELANDPRFHHRSMLSISSLEDNLYPKFRKTIQRDIEVFP